MEGTAGAQEEFQEAEILWPDDGGKAEGLEVRRSSRAAKKRRRSRPQETPIPVSHSWAPGHTYDRDPVEGETDGGDKGWRAMPPHVLVARRTNEKTAFSVFAGNGRTLKGRDLRRVRDAVLRMTGFLER